MEKLVNENSKVDRSRACMLLAYPDSTDMIVLREWLAGCEFSHWAAVHDHEGKTHMHIVVWSRDVKTASAWSKWLINTGCPAVYPCNEKGVRAFSLWRDVRDAVRYLVHKDNPDKFQGYVLSDDFSTDSASAWLADSASDAHFKKAFSGADGARPNACLLQLVDDIELYDIRSLTRLLRLYSEDAPMLRFVREHWSICRDLVREQSFAVPAPIEDPLKNIAVLRVCTNNGTPTNAVVDKIQVVDD